MTNASKESNLRATIVTVAYAATFAYGLKYWDNLSIDNFLNIIYITFIYALLITDWFNIYIRLQFSDYMKKNLFIFDILVIFLMSRVMSASINEDIIMYWWFMFSIFCNYTLWDIVIWCTKVWTESKADWLSNLIGDSVITLILLSFCICVIPGETLLPCITSAILLFVCILAIINWLKPFSSLVKKD